MRCRSSFGWTLVLLILAAADHRPCQAGEPRKSDESFTPKAHKNHVRRTSAEYLSWSRRMTFYYDYATAAELARDTGRPMFVIFCRSGSIGDPITGKPRCAS